MFATRGTNIIITPANATPKQADRPHKPQPKSPVNRANLVLMVMAAEAETLQPPNRCRFVKMGSVKQPLATCQLRFQDF